MILVTMANEEVVKERWTPEMLAAIQTYYTEVEKLGSTTVYRPGK